MLMICILKYLFKAIAACLLTVVLMLLPQFQKAGADDRSDVAAAAYNYDQRWKLYGELREKYKWAEALEILT